MEKSSTKWLVGSVVALILVFLVLWGAWQAFFAASEKHAVKLENGSIYFGKLVTFPDFGLKNVYTIQRTGNKKQPLSVRSFKQSFWGPKGFMEINRDNVIWKAELSPESQLNQIIENGLPANQRRGTRRQRPAPGQQGQQPSGSQQPQQNTNQNSSQ
ncbi:MAG: hypothetical protein ABEI53_03500 [Candidatus Magasanikbacteria bacterium]